MIIVYASVILMELSVFFVYCSKLFKGIVTFLEVNFYHVNNQIVLMYLMIIFYSIQSDTFG